MNLQNIVRKKIIEEVLSAYYGEWATLIYDEEAAYVLQTIFKKSDFPSYGIMTAVRIDEDRDSWDFPGIYFIESTAENIDTINKEFAGKKYSSIRVCCLNTPQGLDPLIKFTTLSLNIRALEERIFICRPEDLTSIFNIFSSKFSIHYLPSLQGLAEDLQGLQNQNGGPEERAPDSAGSNTFLLLADRGVDLFTPLLHFFSFRSAVTELDDKVTYDDPLYPELRNKHLAEGSRFLQQYIDRLNRSQQQLGREKLDTASLSKMVVDAPKNVEIKEAIEKYSGVLGKAIGRLEFLKDLVEAEQILATGYDKRGRKTKKNLDFFFEYLGSSKYSMEDRLRLLFLLKANGISLSQIEQMQLAISGFDERYIVAAVDCGQHIKRATEPRYDYDVSRYEPIITDLVTGFAELKPVFQGLGPAPDGLGSLRKKAMLTGDRKGARRIVVLYIRGGLSVEECRVAYTLSDVLGIDLFIGSDRTLTPAQFIEDLIKASEQ